MGFSECISNMPELLASQCSMCVQLSGAYQKDQTPDSYTQKKSKSEMLIIDCEAGEIICSVASICLCVCISELPCLNHLT